ncbi:MAG: LysM peptidoglycan-binding domain-containing protein, partial [Gilliamella sp.]|nr:LysM peptidoglycan-binding domain-containing protein [Gilliamella sp.]
YLVKAGDSLYSIAQNYRVKITDILQWNNLKNSRVQEGDMLTINLVNANPI